MRILQTRLSGYDSPQKVMAAGIHPYFKEKESDQDTVVKIFIDFGTQRTIFGTHSNAGYLKKAELNFWFFWHNFV